MLRRRQRRFFASGIASAQDKGTLALDRLLFERMPRGRCRIADQRRKRRGRRLAGKQLPSFTVAQPLWEMTGSLLAMEIRTGEGVESSPWAYGQGKGRKRGWESSRA